MRASNYLESEGLSAPQGSAPCSLGPKAEPTTIEVLTRRAGQQGLLGAALTRWQEGMGRIAQAVHRNFPENVFLDLDLLGRRLATLRIEDLDESIELIEQLHEVFGRHDIISFRYIHDFLYGFDWVKWVRREPETRAQVGPYDLPFLRHIRRRGDELRELIRKDDETYPKLASGEPRNPFRFSREPADERALHRELARDGQLPVEAWLGDGKARWDIDFGAVRARIAQEMGLS